MSKPRHGVLQERVRLYSNKEEQKPVIYKRTLQNVYPMTPQPKIHRKMGSPGAFITVTKPLKEAMLNDEVKYAGKVAKYYLDINKFKASKKLVKKVSKRNIIQFTSPWEKKHFVKYILHFSECKSLLTKDILMSLTKVQLVNMFIKLL